MDGLHLRSNPLQSGAAGALAALARPRVTYSQAGDPLTADDVKMLRATSGMQDFTWPPDENHLVPEGAYALASYRRSQEAAGIPLSRLTGNDVKKMAALGMLTDGLVTKFTDYVNGKSVTAPGGTQGVGKVVTRVGR